MRWDVFCRVIDNHGDAGVCWRLAAELARRGHLVRLWIDDPSLLAWMAPAGETGVTVVPWTDSAPDAEPGDVVVEAFGCDPPPAFVRRMVARPQPVWINLEYLSAERYVERNHGLPSPVLQGPAAGLTKHFFYPGFTAATGGLLREQDWKARRSAFDAAGFLRGLGADPALPSVSLFCYEPPSLRHLGDALPACNLLVTAGRARRALEEALRSCPLPPRVRPLWLPLLSQHDYDHLLWACDFNFARGEDSVVRALLAGAPFAWQLYPQSDDAHLAKLGAFLDWLAPPADWAAVFRAWNAASPQLLPPLDLAAWRPHAAEAASRAWALPELAGTLERFALDRARI